MLLLINDLIQFFWECKSLLESGEKIKKIKTKETKKEHENNRENWSIIPHEKLNSDDK